VPGRLFINGKPAGSVNFAQFGGSVSETLDIGQVLGTAVCVKTRVCLT
jgi:hypothetical protein